MSIRPSARRAGLTGAQMSRHTELKGWLVAGRRFNANDATDHFGISRRTFQQDIEYLRLYGYEIDFDRRLNAFVLSGKSGDLPVPQIQRSEYAAILLAKHVFETIGVGTAAAAVESIAERVRALSPEILGMNPADFHPSLAFVGGPAPAIPLPWLGEVSRAIEEGRTIDITYFTMYRNASTARLVNPSRILTRDGRGYLVGWCHKRKDVLIFRMDRIKRLTLTDRFFETDPAFDLEAFLGPMFGMFKGKQDIDVKVRFSPFVAPWIIEERWHRSQKITQLPDGSVQLDMTVSALHELQKWVMGFGADAEVLEPLHLRRDVQCEVEKMGAKYSQL